MYGKGMYPEREGDGRTQAVPDSGDDAMLRVVGATKAFDGLLALESVSFDVRAGHIKALIGPNGAGKTTLLNVINGLLRPDEGHVYFQGHDLVGMKTDRTALLGLSRTFQLIRLFSVNNATVLDNVMIGAHKQLMPTISGSLFFRSRTGREEAAARDKAMEMLKFVGLEKAAFSQPGALSFGNQRLVELARSLMADPLLLLLDEPASGLNDAEVESFMELLSVVKGRGVTILLVEHNMKLVMNISDDIVVLDFGRRLAEGPPSAICANPEVIEAYLGAECAGPGGA
jgi:ABC-type branched-subunit amino acid transport system ATPase component